MKPITRPLDLLILNCQYSNCSEFLGAVVFVLFQFIGCKLCVLLCRNSIIVLLLTLFKQYNNTTNHLPFTIPSSPSPPRLNNSCVLSKHANENENFLLVTAAPLKGKTLCRTSNCISTDGKLVFF